MPDLYSHTEVAKKVISKIDYDFNKDLVYVAAQGPDPMYYNVFNKESKEYRYYADRMHDTNTGMLLTHMTQYVKRHPSVDNYSFLIGFITHYALDVTIHPYVYYNVGDYKESDPSTHHTRGLHLKFERSIDAVLIEEDTKKKAHKITLHKSHFPLKELPTEVSKIMGYALKQTYGKDNGDYMFKLAVSKMYNNIKYMTKDRFGLKKLIFRFLDLFHNNNLFYQDVSLYKHIEDYDYLNKQKNTWHHPVTNEPSNQSIYDLQKQGIVFAEKIIKQVNNYIFKDKAVNFEDVFTNLSFNTGRDCTHGQVIKYYKAYRK